MVTVVTNKNKLIKKPSKPTAYERPNPVNPMVFPAPAHQGRPKRCSRVHGSPIKRPTHQSIRSNDEANHNRRYCSQTFTSAPGVNGGSIHRVHQSKRHHHLQHHSVSHFHTARKSINRYSLSCTIAKLNLFFLMEEPK